MEDCNTHVNPRLKRVIQSYQTSAIRSLSGPKGLSLLTGCLLGQNSRSKMCEIDICNLTATNETGGELENFERAPKSFPVQQMPVFMPVDKKSERTDTVLEGETIACFAVGGEKRLCLPQILNTVLRDFNLKQINKVCDELHIYCARCNQIQLDTLKNANILPSAAPSCGLITKTDAERLCSALLYGNPERSTEPLSRNNLRVYHKCFGKCKGIFNSDAYTTPDSKCVRCVDCYGMFSPQKFVCHSHKPLENRTCHWGFDSSNWRSYLMLAKDQNLSENGRLQDMIEEIKLRFDPSHKHKKRQYPEWSSRNDPGSSKRVKTEDTGTRDSKSATASTLPRRRTYSASNPRQLSAFLSWSVQSLATTKEGQPLPQATENRLSGTRPSYLHTGPPVLLNPERVVPYSETERYERHFTPNISLAPSSGQKSSFDCDDEEEMWCQPSTSKTSPVKHNQSSIQKASVKTCSDIEEYDIATDTDDSSLASPLGGFTYRDLQDMPLYKSTLLQEMEMVHSLLGGLVVRTPEAHARFFQEYSRIRAKTEEAIQWLLQANAFLKQEIEASQRRNIELEVLVSTTERKIRSLALEKEYAIEEVRTQTEQSQIHKQIDQELAVRLRKVENLYLEACKENHALRRELATLSDTSAKQYAAQDGSRAMKSCLKIVLDSDASREVVKRESALKLSVMDR